MCVVERLRQEHVFKPHTFSVKRKNSYKSGWIFTVLMPLEVISQKFSQLLLYRIFLNFFLLSLESIPWFVPRNNIYSRKMLLLVIFPKPLSTKSSFRSCFLLGFSLSHLLIGGKLLQHQNQIKPMKQHRGCMIGLTVWKIVVSLVGPLTCTEAWIETPFFSIRCWSDWSGPSAHT